MSNAPVGVVKLSVREQARAARAAARKLALLSNDTRNAVLLEVSKRTEQNAARILAANGEDCKAAGELVRSGKLSEAAFARLRVTEKTIREMAQRLEGGIVARCITRAIRYACRCGDAVAIAGRCDGIVGTEARGGFDRAAR